MLIKTKTQKTFPLIFDSTFSYCKEEYDKENLILSINYDVAAKKRKKDLLNNNTKIPCKCCVLHKHKQHKHKQLHHVLFFHCRFSQR